MKNLPEKFKTQVDELANTGLTSTGRVFVENFMLAEVNRQGADNREILLQRIRRATDAQKAAAIAVFDEFVKECGK